MRKRFLELLVIATFLVSCNKDGASQCSSSVLEEETDLKCTITAEPVSTNIPDTASVSPTELPFVPVVTTPDVGPILNGLPNEAYTFNTNIDFINTTPTQQEKFDRAVDIIKKVIATEEFRELVINHTYNGSKTYVDNGGFTNTQIYQKILDGAEGLFPVKNNTMDMGVELYYAATSTVGYTYSNTTQIWVNTKYFNTNAVTSVASNLMHEWLHKLGFRHASSYSVSRDYSVPYAIGRMVGNIGRKLN